ncbi:MAG: hypothetical protein ACOCNX_00710 [Prevotella sp.]
MTIEQSLERELERENKLKAVGCPYVLSYFNHDGSYNIPSIHESIYWDYVAGIITLEEAAGEFNLNGWTAYRDIEYTRKQIARLDRKYHKLSNH